jgi:hypothetical protein
MGFFSSLFGGRSSTKQPSARAPAPVADDTSEIANACRQAIANGHPFTVPASDEHDLGFELRWLGDDA